MEKGNRGAELIQLNGKIEKGNREAELIQLNGKIEKGNREAELIQLNGKIEKGNRGAELKTVESARRLIFYEFKHFSILVSILWGMSKEGEGLYTNPSAKTSRN